MTNDARRAGQVAGGEEVFGEFSRFKVFAVHTRFDAVQWFVTDAEKVDDAGLPAVIRQESTREAALLGLA